MCVIDISLHSPSGDVPSFIQCDGTLLGGRENCLPLHSELTHIDSTHYVVSSTHYVGDCDSTHYECSDMIHSLRRRLNQSQHSEFSHYVVSRTHYIVIDSISYIDSLCSDSIAYIVSQLTM